MLKVIGIRFQQNGKVYQYNADTFSPSVGDYVIVNTSHGYDLGEVMVGIQEIDETVLNDPLEKMIRFATEQDVNHATESREREQEAFSICQKKILEHNLEMKLVSVECMFDNSKIIFYFTANGRVDFRTLVKDLASVFKTRIELRQIGVRDEARMLGGLGPCGRHICCGAFLKDFQPVSIKMAKEQSLSLNPTKISGVCGRLMCCLKYEQDYYESTRKKMPRIGKEVVTPEGNGTVFALNIVKETVSVRFDKGDDSEIKDFPMEQVSSPDFSKTRENRTNNTESENQPTPDEGIKETDPDSFEIPFEEESAAAEPEISKLKQTEPPRKHKSNTKKESTQTSEGTTKGPKERNDIGNDAEIAKPARKLGQPVRRENPGKNRTDDNKKLGTKGSVISHERKAVNPEMAEKKPSTDSASKKSGSNWAIALEKAIKAADDSD